MAIAPGTYELGPQNGELVVNTRRQGAAAKAGHDLEMVVTSWRGTLEVGASAAVSLSADGTSLRVRAGHGGIQALDEKDKENIRQTIDDEVLRGSAIEFHSSDAQTTGGQMHVRGELELMGQTRPLEFELKVTDGRLTGRAIVKQSDWGMKPYSALFGALKVADEVEITVDAGLQPR